MQHGREGCNTVRERTWIVINKHGTDKTQSSEERSASRRTEIAKQVDTRKYYEKLNRSRKGHVPQATSHKPCADMCWNLSGNLFTNECAVIERWRRHFNEHLNGNEAEHGDGMVTDLGVPAPDDTFPASRK